MINLAVVGTGGMANHQTQCFKAIDGVNIVSACDIVPGKAKEFAKKYDIPTAYESIDKMLDNEKVDAVTVVTPDAAHKSTALEVISRGKHILCEKPLATNHADAQQMAEAALKKGIIHMVNLSYRNSSAIQKAHQLVEEGKLGRIMHIEASYLQSWLTGKLWGDWRTSTGWLWRLSTRHGSGGVLGDIGVHILDFATFAAGSLDSVDCQLKTYHKAEGDKIGEYPLDANDSAVISAEFSGGAIGSIHLTRWATGHANSLRLRVYGDLGSLEIDLDRSYTHLRICQGSDIDKVKWKTLRCGTTPSIYERFIHSIQSGKQDKPDFVRGALVQKWLDACFESNQTHQRVNVSSI
jgi:predicted dehydrogenase